MAEGGLRLRRVGDDDDRAVVMDLLDAVPFEQFRELLAE